MEQEKARASGFPRNKAKKWEKWVWLEAEAAKWHSCFDGELYATSF